MKKRHLLFIVLFLTSCAGIKVKTQYNPAVDFTTYKTWCWLQGCEVTFEGPAHLYDSAAIEDISNYIAQEMYEKGFTQGDKNSDLLLDFHIVVKEDSALFARVHEEDLPYWNDYQEDYYHFLRGTIIVDIVDRSKGEVIWQSSGERYMALFPDLDDKTIKQSVKKLLKKFPPEQK